MPITKIDQNLIYVFLVAGTVIRQDNKYLLVQELQKKYYGMWNLPAGKVELGGLVEETAVRETKEETGFEVEIIREIDIFHQDGDKSVKHAFEAKIVVGELKIPEDEFLDAKCFTYEEIKRLSNSGKLRADWVIKAIKKSQNPS